MFKYNNLNQTKPLNMYLASPGGKKIGKLSGINQAHLHMLLRDAWEIEFEIDKYVDQKKNKLYDYLLPFMEIYVEPIGWFRLNTLPTENESDGRVYKTFTAYGIETQLYDLDLILMHVNLGIDTSLEMFEENKARGSLKRNIKFYIRDASDDITSDKYWGLGLLNILERTYFSKKGWTIGEVSTTLLSKERSFEIDSVDGFSFLMSDCANAFQCIFTFDRINKKINAAPMDDFGKSLNIECSFRNLLNTVTITDRLDKTYTKFFVQGANSDTSIIYVNFGQDYIENLSYVLSEKYFPKTFLTKYDSYLTYRESRRKEYANIWTRDLELQSQIDELYHRYPVDEVAVKWNAYDLAGLHKELDAFQEMLRRLEEKHTVNGILKIENTSDYSLYLCIKNVILPDIQAEISRQEAGSTAEATKTDYKFNWDLYGINGLKERKSACENNKATLAQKGYDKPPENKTDTFHQKQYEQYLKMDKAIKDIDARLSVLNAQVTELQKQKDTVTDTRAQIVTDVDIHNPNFGFTSDELSLLETLRSETDFKDTSIEVFDPNDIQDKIDRAWDLLASAQEELEIECRPQQTFSISMDNIYHIDSLKEVANQLENGDFMFLELDGGYKTKQRIIEIEMELVNFNDMDFIVTFSDMAMAYGKYNDLRFLSDQANASSKNSITRSDKKYIQETASSAANNVLNQYFSGSGTIFPNGLSQEDALILSDILSGLIDGNLTLDELKVKLAKIDHMDADTAFAKYLESVSLVATNGKFDQLDVKMAAINNLLAGNITSDNIKAGSITTDRLEAKNGWITNAMIEQGAIDTAQIADGSITDAKIVDLTANKITAGKLDAGQIEVVNLNAANITVGTINGHQIASGAVDLSKLGTDVTNIMDDTAADAQQALDDALAAFSQAQTAQNSAASAQATADGKNTILYQPTVPAITGRKKNDIWYDTDNDNKMYYFDGAAWIPALLGTSALEDNSVTSDKITASVNNAIAKAETDAAKGITDAASALAAAIDADEKAQAAQTVANAAQVTANGKNTVFYQASAPAVSGRKVNDIWYDTDDGYKMYHFDGKAWVADTFGAGAIADGVITADKIADEVNKKITDAFGTAEGAAATASSAVSTAATAKSTAATAAADASKAVTAANTAKTDAATAKTVSDNAASTASTAKITADNAASTASAAQSAAETAKSAASTAQMTADGKNTVFYQTTAPAVTGRKINDIWYDTDDGNKMYYFDGKAWTASQFGTNALANAAITNALIADAAILTANIADLAVSSGKIANAAIGTAKISDLAVTGAKMANATITNAKIADATIESAKIKMLDAGKITTGTLSADRIGAGSIAAAKLMSNTITAASGVIADAAIETAKIKDLAVTGAKIANATIGTAKIATASITNALIADATIQNSKIANLDAAKITTGTLSAARIGANSITIGKLDAPTQNIINNASILATASVGGKLIYKDPCFSTGTNGVTYYNNNQSTSATVTCSRVAKASDSPSPSGYEMKIVITGSGSPGLGGFVQQITSRASAHFIVKYIIKLPTGYNLTTASNSMGSGYIDRWLTDTSGTGKYKEYIREIICGTTGTFSTGGQVYITGPTPTPASPLTFYLSGIWQYDITGMERDIDSVISTWCYNNDTTYINGGKIYAGTVSASQIAANAVVAGKIAANAVTAGTIATNAVTTGSIAASAVTTDKLSANTVTASKIASDAITSDKIVAGAVTSAKIATNSITANHIASNAITSEKITSNSITADKIAAGTITAAQIKSGTITAKQIAGKTITAEQIATGTIAAEQIATNAITADKIASGTITADKIKSGTITANQIASRTITTDKIAGGSITANEIKTGTITADKINVSNLFAQDITATGTIRGVNLAGAKGSFTGDVVATNIYTKDALKMWVKTDTPSTELNVISINKYWGGVNYYLVIGETSKMLGDGDIYAGTVFKGESVFVGGVSCDYDLSVHENLYAQSDLYVNRKSYFSDSGISVGSGNAVSIWKDGEGGNIRIYGPNNSSYAEMDMYNNVEFRFYSFADNNGGYKGVTLNRNSGDLYLVGGGTLVSNGDIVSAGNMWCNKKINFGNSSTFRLQENGIAFLRAIELPLPNGYIDFHYNGSSADYTARLIETSSGSLVAYNSISNASDERLKENIEEVPDAYLELFERIRPKIFNYKSSPNTLNIGLVAQEILEAEKELGIENSILVRGTGKEIKYNSENKAIIDYYSIDYNALATLAITYFLKRGCK